MRVTHVSHFRKNLAMELDRAHDDWEPLLVFRTGGKSAAVVMSLEQYNSISKRLGESDHAAPSPKDSA